MAGRLTMEAVAIPLTTRLVPPTAIEAMARMSVPGSTGLMEVRGRYAMHRDHQTIEVLGQVLPHVIGQYRAVLRCVVEGR